MNQFTHVTLHYILFLMMISALSSATISCSAEKNLAVTTNSEIEGLSEPNNEISYTEVSANFVDGVIHGLDVEEHLRILKNVNSDLLDAALNTPRERLAFWTNIYNGFSQYFLQKDSTLYVNDRGAFFSKEQIPIAGYKVSLEDIEHGVLRRGATIWSKGYVRIRAFRKEFIQKFAVETVDYRIHFALNCGAKSCPPVVVYHADTVSEQLNNNTEFYLENQVIYEDEKNIVKVPALMKWFSADFGGDDADKRAILRKYGVLPELVRPEVKYLPYDWSLDIENYKSYDI